MCFKTRVNIYISVAAYMQYCSSSNCSVDKQRSATTCEQRQRGGRMCKQVNMDINNAVFTIFKLNMCHEERSV